MDHNLPQQLQAYKQTAKKAFKTLVGLLIAFLIINSSILVLAIYNYFEIQYLKEQTSQRN